MAALLWLWRAAPRGARDPPLIVIVDAPASIPPFGSGLSPRGCGPDADSGQRRSSACRRRPERDALAVGRSDLVVSDVGMPGEDGYRLIASLRARRTRPGAAEPRVL